jgi:hypothetical protein
MKWLCSQCEEENKTAKTCNQFHSTINPFTTDELEIILERDCFSKTCAALQVLAQFATRCLDLESKWLNLI